MEDFTAKLVMNTYIANLKTTPARHGRAAYFISMAVAILFLYVLNNISTNGIQPIDPALTPYYSGWLITIIDKLAAMQVPYLTRYFISCLWAINLFLGFSMMGNFTLLLYRPRWFHHLVMALICLVAVLAVYVFYHVFPLDIHSDSTATLARIILIVIMAAAGAALIRRLVLFIKALLEREPLPLPPALPVSPLPPEIPVDSTPQSQSAPPQTPPDTPVSIISPDLPVNTAQPVQPELPQTPQPPTPPHQS